MTDDTGRGRPRGRTGEVQPLPAASAPMMARPEEQE